MVIYLKNQAFLACMKGFLPFRILFSCLGGLLDSWRVMCLQLVSSPRVPDDAMALLDPDLLQNFQEQLVQVEPRNACLLWS